jgi:hypothetical protein
MYFSVLFGFQNKQQLLSHKTLTDCFHEPSKNYEKECLSVPLFAWKNLAPIGRIFMKFDTWVFSYYVQRKFQFH